jgi:ubiquinone/menaquinone biosynthesis C-methylase UbiE
MIRITFPKSISHRAILNDYQSLAEIYDRHWSVFLSYTHNWILAHLENPGNVIDMGCGTGRLLELIRQKYPDSKLNNPRL